MAAATIKKITEVEIVSAVSSETNPGIYIETNGAFRRAKGSNAREAVGLGGLVVSDGMLCMEMES